MSEWTIGIIGGSGLYEIDALEDAQWIAVDTPWGAPSDELLTGRIEGAKFVFLPRHGRGHRIPPGDLNFRAEYRRAEAGRLHRYPRHLGGRIAARGIAAGAVRGGRPIYRPDLRAGVQLLRPRPRRACVDGRSDLPAPVRARRGGGARRREPRSSAAAAIWRSRARNFRPGRRAGSTVSGAPT